MQHSIISPSSAAQWVNCAASIPAQANIIDDNADGEEGEALHAVAYDVFSGNTTANCVINSTINHVIITQDMVDRVQQYITYINSIRNDASYFEERVNCSVIHPECFGTPDYWEFNPVTNILTIADYKNGFLDISPVENWQLICYVAGIIATLPIGTENTLIIRFVIVQPRSYGETLKIWKVPATHIRGHINRLCNAAHIASSPPQKATPGEHCRYCAGMFSCFSSTKTVNNLAHIAVYTPEAPENDISTELTFLNHAEKMIKHRKAIVEAKAFQEIKNGGTVQGFTVGTGRGKLDWKPDVKGLGDIGVLMGINIKKSGYITPTQAKNAGVPDDMLKPFTVYKTGKAILKPVNTKKAQEIFSA